MLLCLQSPADIQYTVIPLLMPEFTSVTQPSQKYYSTECSSFTGVVEPSPPPIPYDISAQSSLIDPLWYDGYWYSQIFSLVIYWCSLKKKCYKHNIYAAVTVLKLKIKSVLSEVWLYRTKIILNSI